MTPALSLYLLAAARAEPLMARRAVMWSPTGTDALRRRPTGELVWLHLAGGESPSTASMIASRIAEERPRTEFVVTSDDPAGAEDEIAWLPRPPDFPRTVDAFLAAWEPNAAVWIGGPIWPALAAKARQAGIPMLLANATEELAGVHRGIPARDLLGLFGSVSARTESDAAALTRALRRPVPAIGQLQRSTRPLDYDEAEHRRLTAALQTRPVWFAVRATSSELDALRVAHLAGQGVSHRLLLIVQPGDDPAAVILRDRYAARRSDGRAPPAAATAFVADRAGEEGLWYRLASVTFVGGTLAGPEGKADPFEAAALGSAILHGPNVAPYRRQFDALEAARASRMVRDPERLGQAVAELLAPDRAAALAHRAWEVVSDGAEATDRVVEEVCRLLDLAPR